MVTKGLKVRLLPDEETIRVLNQNIGNRRFVWNNVLSRYHELLHLYNFYGYSLSPNIKILNNILVLLKKDYPFLYDGESTSQQQACRDLKRAFDDFFKNKKGYPKFKSKKNSKKSFRIQNNGNTVRASNRRLRLAKLGFVNYHTSREYRKLLKTSKINHVTVKKENGKFYAIVNVETPVEPFEKTGKAVGIDLGLKNLATLSNGQVITHVDLSKEDKMIRKYQEKLSRQKYQSQNYKKTLKKYHKWQNKKNNKKYDAYHKFSYYLVKNFDIIAMETLNIKGMLKNDKWSPKLQKIGLSELKTMIKDKCGWYGKEFIEIDRFYPSTKLCNVCGYKYEDITLDVREWTCPKCHTTHDRDINAAKNILNEALRLKNKSKKG